MTSAEGSVTPAEQTPRQAKITALLIRYDAALPKPAVQDEEPVASPR